MKNLFLALFLLVSMSASATFLPSDGEIESFGSPRSNKGLPSISECSDGSPTSDSPTNSGSSCSPQALPPRGYTCRQCAKDWWDAQILRERSEQTINRDAASTLLRRAERREARVEAYRDQKIQGCIGCYEYATSCNPCIDCCAAVKQATGKAAKTVRTLPKRLTMESSKDK